MNIMIIKTIFFDSLVKRLNIRLKPKVLQIPITSRCNSKCKTCNVWKHTEHVDIDYINLRIAFQDPFFDQVKYVGLNGGEITLIKEWKSIIDTVLTLKKIKSIHVISNGLLTDKLLHILSETKIMCKNRNVRLEFTLSVDGVGSIHDNIRGIPKAFTRVRYLLDEISANPGIYCDQMVIGCTISQYNIPYIREIEYFFSQYPFNIEFHLAVPNKRIYTFDDYENYYVLSNERTRLLAAEFFYYKSKDTKRLMEKMKYFSIYYFLKNKGKGRLCQCNYLNRDVTIDESLNLSLCATASDIAGSLIDTTATELKKKRILAKLAKNNVQYCNTCIHYSAIPTIKGILIYIVDNLYAKFCWNNKFKYLVKW